MAENHPEAMNPNSLPVDVMARLLTKAGRQTVTETMLRADIDSGAPTNSDGTFNLVHYTAWNVQQLSRKTDGN